MNEDTFNSSLRGFKKSGVNRRADDTNREITAEIELGKTALSASIRAGSTFSYIFNIFQPARYFFRSRPHNASALLLQASLL